MRNTNAIMRASIDLPPVAVDHDHVTAFCPAYRRAMELIGRRWTGSILRALLSGATRFSDVTAAVPGLSDRLLSERFKELEAEGIITRVVTPAIPVRIDYRLTEKGRALHDVILAVSTWAETWPSRSTCPTDHGASPAGDRPAHQGTGTAD
jgi:DNA-binding HxlR family transcriptional regulator